MSVSHKRKENCKKQMNNSKITENNRSSNGLFVWCLEALLFQGLVVSISLTLQHLKVFTLHTIHFWAIVMILITAFAHLFVQITVASYIQSPFITSFSSSSALKKGTAEGNLCTNFVIIALYAFFYISELQSNPWKPVLAENNNFSLSLLCFIYCIASMSIMLLISICNAFAATPHDQGNSLFFKESVVCIFAIVFIIFNESQQNYFLLCSSTFFTFLWIILSNIFVLMSYLIFVAGVFYKYKSDEDPQKHSFKINIFAILNAGISFCIWTLYYFIAQNINLEIFVVIMSLIGSIILNNVFLLWRKISPKSKSTEAQKELVPAAIRSSNSNTEVLKATSIKDRTQFMRSRLKTANEPPNKLQNSDKKMQHFHPGSHIIVDKFEESKFLKKM